MIVLKNVCRSFKTKRRFVKAVNNVSLTFPSSGFIFLVGASGAGKSSLLNLISLQDRATSGKIVIDGNDISKLNEKELSTIRNTYFGIMFQDNNLIDDLSVYQNLDLTLKLQNRSLARDDAEKLLESIGLSNDIIDERPGDLSGGQCQRIAFARSVLKGSEVIICDEPTGSLDSKNAKGVMDLLKDYSKEKLVIVVSHDTSLAKEYSDRIIEISEGRVVSDNGSTNSLSSEDDIHERDLTTHHPHLPFKSKLSFAFHSFKGIMGKSIIAFLSFFITLSALMATCSIEFYDSSNAIRNAIKTNDIQYVMAEKYRYVNKYFSDGSFFNEEDIEDINKIYGDDYLLANHSSLMGGSSEYNGGDFYVKNIVPVNQKNIENFGFDIIGNVPHDGANQREIMLTSYECYLLGWISENDMSNKSVLEKIIAEKTYKTEDIYGARGNEYIFSISGIVDTHYSLPDSENKDDMYLANQKAILDDELHLSLFFSPEVFHEIMKIDDRTFGEDGEKYYFLYYATKDDSYFKIDQLNEDIDTRQAECYVENQIRLDPSINNVNNFMSVAQQVLEMIAGFFLIIYILSFASFIESSVSNRIPTMKTLKSLGINNSGIYSIFVLQSAIITVIATFLSSFVYLGLVLEYDKMLLNSFVLISPLSFNILIVLVCLLASLAFSSLLVYLFSLRLFKRKKIR